MIRFSSTNKSCIAALACLTALSTAANGSGTHQSVSIKAILNRTAPAKVGMNTLELVLTNSDGKQVVGAKISLDVEMTSMDMGSSHPSVTEKVNGVYSAQVRFSMTGPWKITATVKEPSQMAVTKSFEFSIVDKPMEMGSMGGRLGNWSMAREGSGTSWLPDSSPMFMKMLPESGQFDLSLMGYFTLDGNNSGGPRGSEKFFSTSMPMLMARRETGGGILGFNLMMSLDPIFDGEYGYPNLFQTGETAHGNRLVDFQHPHNLIAEVSASYSHPIAKGIGGFVYGGPIGEPALGGPNFAHRPSGFEIPEAPISHHWFDSTHISNGVITTGLNTDKWQVEGSVFNGHEPGENRYIPGQIGLNSASTRLTYNPTHDLSFSASYGYLDSPESTEPGSNQNRFTASAIWSQPMGHGDNLSVTWYLGRKTELGQISDAYLLEGTYLRGPDSYFIRWENVDETELPDVPVGSYRINKILFGDVHNLAKRDGFELGFGAYMGLYSFPSSLDPYYGRSPVTLGVFLRLRPTQMSK